MNYYPMGSYPLDSDGYISYLEQTVEYLEMEVSAQRVVTEAWQQQAEMATAHANKLADQMRDARRSYNELHREWSPLCQREPERKRR